MTNLPQRIGNYKLERRIGKGGMSEVWLARHHSLEDRQVAIKLLLSHDQEWVERFTHEANITSRLRHEYIIQIYDHGYQQSYHYTIMEYVPGGALRDVLKESRRLRLESALHVFRCAGMALDYAHAHGVIHRDVSPGNILVERGTGRVLLTDFGIARQSGKDGLTTVSKLMGTPGYLSPEHASSATAVTHLSDIYSLGIVLFEMLSGQLPWDYYPGMPDNKGGPFTAPKLLRSCAVEGLPPDVERVMQTMLAIEPSKRYPSAQAAIDDLDNVLTRHTSLTQVVTSHTGEQTPKGQANHSVGSATRLASTNVVLQPHPVEIALGPDLLKGPLEQARKLAETLSDPQQIASLLNKWSEAGRFRRRLLGRQALVHQTLTSNTYFYTLRILYETREPAQKNVQPDYEAVTPPLEKEVEPWVVTLPKPRDFVDEASQTIDLPGTLKIVNCQTCNGIGKTTCPRCKGERRIVSAREPIESVAIKSRGVPKATGDLSSSKSGNAVISIRPSPATSATILIACPECSGVGGLPCKSCDGVGRMVEKKTMTWRRWTGTFTSHDQLPQIDEKWLERMCKHTEIYRERQQGGLRATWQAVPPIADLIKQAQEDLNTQSTRIVLSEVAVSFIPITEIIFDIGDPPEQPQNTNTNTDHHPIATTKAYSWHIYGFEKHLPNDWRFLNWDRVIAVLAGLAAIILGAFLLLSLALRV